jgi:rhamnulokinase
MLDAISEQLAETGQLKSDDPSFIAKTILDSLALRYASVLRSIESLTGRKLEGVHIIGGGSLNEYLNQATASAFGVAVKAGPVEATVIGNALAQAIACGKFASLAEARRYTGDHVQLKTYEPRPSRTWEEASSRYEEIERRYCEER